MAAGVHLVKPDVEQILGRLRKIEGQVGGVQRMLAEGRDCAEVAQQVAAARGALDRVAIDLIAAGMAQCVEMTAAGRQGGRAGMDRLRRAFLMLR